MRIVVDISQIAYEGTGVARFTRGLVESILAHDEKKHEFVFFFSSLRRMLDEELTKKFEGRNYHLFRYILPPSALSFLWNDIHVVKLERLVGAFDWVVTSDWTEPPSHFKKATVVHDLAFMRYPHTVDPLILTTQKKRLRWVKKESDIVFADSHATRDDLIDKLAVDKEKIHVNYPGVAIDKPEHSMTSIVREKYQLKKPFVLTVGKIEPRKNLSRLIEAFSNVKTDCDLVIVGPSGWDNIRAQRENIKFLGFVDDAELSVLYSSCLFFAYPSIWEGFGYPVIEAMTLGAPVATSKTSSLGEVAKDAALLFDPHEVPSIQKALEDMIANESLRKELAQKGKKRAAEFTWEKYYKNFISTIENNS